MVDGRIGEAEKNLLRYRVRQLIVLKQVRQQPVGIVPADGTQDHVRFRIPEGRKQILRPLFRVRLHILRPLQGVGHEPDLQPVFLQPAQADFRLKADKGLSRDPAG